MGPDFPKTDRASTAPAWGCGTGDTNCGSLLCQLTCQSADIMSSLCGVGVRVNNFFSKTTRPRDMLFFLKIPYLSRMKNCSRHANLSVRLFARDITRGVPPPKVKISTFYHNFLSDYCRDFSHILHMCTRPEVDSFV